jgi:hypothetical protein
MKFKADLLKDEIDRLKINVDSLYKLSSKSTNDYSIGVFKFGLNSLNKMIAIHNSLLFKISYYEKRYKL